VVTRIVGIHQICFDKLVGAAYLVDVCCGLMRECAPCQFVTCYPGRCMLWFDGRMYTLSVGKRVFLIFKFE
jgi:hypothetical protein